MNGHRLHLQMTSSACSGSNRIGTRRRVRAAMGCNGVETVLIKGGSMVRSGHFQARSRKRIVRDRPTPPGGANAHDGVGAMGLGWIWQSGRQEVRRDGESRGGWKIEEEQWVGLTFPSSRRESPRSG